MGARSWLRARSQEPGARSKEQGARSKELPEARSYQEHVFHMCGGQEEPLGELAWHHRGRHYRGDKDWPVNIYSLFLNH